MGEDRQRGYQGHLGKYWLPTGGRSNCKCVSPFHSRPPVHLLEYSLSQSLYLWGKQGLLSISFFSKECRPDWDSTVLLLIFIPSVTFPVTYDAFLGVARDILFCLVILGSKREALMGKSCRSSGSWCLSLGVCQSMILFCLSPKRAISSWCLARMRDLSQQRMAGVAPGMSFVQRDRIINIITLQHLTHIH